MFEQTFKSIDDILYKDAGADSELDYIEQTSWVLFLRYLDQLESEKADEAALGGKEYQYILDEQFRWPNWAMPKKKKASSELVELDHHKAMTGPDLVQFVDLKLFPYLASFKAKSIDNPKSIEYKIGEIFTELNNKVKSGYNLREIIEMVDELPFGSSKDKHELSHLYESKIKNMGNAGRNGGQYYTPRPLIRAIIEVLNPQIGEKIYDAACGSAGFLCEAYAKAKIHLDNYDPKQQEFLNFVLSQYVKQGGDELDDTKISDLLILKYHAIADAKIELGDISTIRNTFIGFQTYLYERKIAI